MKGYFLLLILAFAGCASAQKFTDLELEAAPEKAKYICGEPISIALTLTNATSQPIDAHADVSPAYGYLEVHIAGPDGAFHRYAGFGWGKGSRPGAPAKIEPGKILRGEITLYSTSRSEHEELLAAPGKYKLRLGWANLGFGERIQAPELEIEVTAPTGKDAVAWNAISADRGVAEFLAVGGDDAQAERAAALLEAHRESVFAGHIELSLGKHYVEHKEPGKARPLLEGAAKAPARSSQRRAAVLHLARALMAMKDEPATKSLLESAQKDFEATVDEALFQKMLREFAGSGH